MLLALLVACRDREVVQQQQPPATTTETVAAAPADLATKTVENVIPLVAPVAQRCEATGSPLQLTIWLSESPKELQVSMRVLDANKREVARATKPANGAKVITLKLDRKLDPGKYRVEGVWGGNVACEQEVEIR